MPTFLLASINSAVFQLKRGGFFQCIKFGWNNIALVDLISIFKNRHKKHTIGEGAAFVYLSRTTTPGSWYSQWHLRTIVQKVYSTSCTVHGSSQFFNEWLPGSNFHLFSLCVQKCLPLQFSCPISPFPWFVSSSGSNVCHSTLSPIQSCCSSQTSTFSTDISSQTSTFSTDINSQTST